MTPYDVLRHRLYNLEETTVGTVIKFVNNIKINRARVPIIE